jgi:hypothetical protein
MGLVGRLPCQFQLVFRLVKHTGADSLPATFTPDGGTSFSLGMLFAWKETLRSLGWDLTRSGFSQNALVPFSEIERL